MTERQQAHRRTSTALAICADPGVDPDGQPIELEGVSIGIVSGGSITEHTDYLDRAALETRLGLRTKG